MSAQVSQVLQGFSSAADGTMSIQGGWENRRSYLRQHGCDPDRVVHAGLSHGTTVAVVNKTHAGTVVSETDGLITSDPGVGLAMTAADCLLVFVHDPIVSRIGMVHAGRRGLAAHIITTFFDVWKTMGMSDLSSCIVTVGPSICADHYTVSDTDAQAFAQWSQACDTRADGIHLDLRHVAREQLLAAGIHNQQITVDPRCTYEEAELFSYRRDHPLVPQLQVGYMMLPLLSR
jgi:YfiH family protein